MQGLVALAGCRAVHNGLGYGPICLRTDDKACATLRYLTACFQLNKTLLRKQRLINAFINSCVVLYLCFVRVSGEFVSDILCVESIFYCYVILVTIQSIYRLKIYWSINLIHLDTKYS